MAKHECGFCCWQPQTTDYSVRKTASHGGKGELIELEQR